ncbi:hypothetical protein ABT160_01550 [Streptomyces sp. NPDC001941]|uniref:hypothetical protein n=1 Tax=Streptomyces sp. NPDC001941 TaxID=3154659 RepID=UPI003333B1FB
MTWAPRVGGRAVDRNGRVCVVVRITELAVHVAALWGGISWVASPGTLRPLTEEEARRYASARGR